MSTVKDVLKALNRDGFYAALRTLGEVEGIDRERRLLLVAYARRVQHLMPDPRSVNALDVAERHANGAASEEDLQTARRAAWDAYVKSREIAYARMNPAAFAAAYAAVYAREAAHEAAYAAASEVERDWQIAELRRVCECIEAGTDPYPRGGA